MTTDLGNAITVTAVVWFAAGYAVRWATERAAERDRKQGDVDGSAWGVRRFRDNWQHRQEEKTPASEAAR